MEYSGGRGNQAVTDNEHWMVSGSTKSNLIQKERIGHMQTHPDLVIIQPTSLDNIEWPIPSGEHFQDPLVGEMEKETDSLVEKLQDEGT